MKVHKVLFCPSALSFPPPRGLRALWTAGQPEAAWWSEGDTELEGAPRSPGPRWEWLLWRAGRGAGVQSEVQDKGARGLD